MSTRATVRRARDRWGRRWRDVDTGPIEIDGLIEEDISTALAGRVSEETSDVALLDREDVVVVEDDPSFARLDHRDVVTVVRSDADVHNDGPQLVQPIWVGDVVGSVEQAELEGKDDPTRELDVPLERFLVFEALQVQGEDIGQLLDLHSGLTKSCGVSGRRTLGIMTAWNAPFLRLLQPAAPVARELVPLAQHLRSAELAQAGRDRRVLLDIDREIEERLVPRRYLQ